MTETIIEAIIRLFAIITDTRDEKESGRSTALVRSFMKANFSDEFTRKYVRLFTQYLEHYHRLFQGSLFGRTPEEQRRHKGLIFEVCSRMVADHDINERYLMVINLLDFVKNKGEVNNDAHEFVQLVAEYLQLDNEEFSDVESFILFDSSRIKRQEQVCVITGDAEPAQPQFKHIYNPNQQVRIIIYRITSINVFIVRYTGPRNLYITGHVAEQRRTYLLPPGSVLKTSRVKPVYFNRILSEYTTLKGETKVSFCADNVSHKFGRKKFGVHPLSLVEESGHLVGIMGGSGSGKSTLLNVLNGNLKLHSGNISINGLDIKDPENKDKLRGVIGYVPQSDTLMEELTVYDNLWFNAKMCFRDLDDVKIKEVVEQSLVDFDLVEAKNLEVGSPSRKIISGGQRKRLNIALELMREPSVLFVDEPTSGLSSMDSEKVMNLLKRQTFNGKLVFAVIHQPSSDIFKMLDRVIIMDQGGYVIFNGNPIESISYFKQQSNLINPEETECITCGNIKAELPLRVVEARMVRPDGKTIRERKRKAADWNKLYEKVFGKELHEDLERTKQQAFELPDQKLKIPSRINQLRLYIRRDVKVKFNNTQYMLLAILQAPMLAMVLGFFTRYNAGTEDNPSAYIFSENVNIPSYFFMSIVVALFLGLIQSAQEIFKERDILKRESFLDLSRFSFLGSKVFVLFTMSAFQMLLYTVIGNLILGVHAMNFHFWLILFSTSCFANMLGLNLSSGLNSAITIYVVIPLILIPQILFSGTVVDFKKLPAFASTPIYSPVMGDLMVSRWSYEAMAVYQYKHNRYRKHIYEAELERQQYIYVNKFLVPKVRKAILKRQSEYIREVMFNEAEHALKKFPEFAQSFPVKKKVENFTLDDGYAFIDSLEHFSDHKMRIASTRKDSLLKALEVKEGGIEGLIAFQKKNDNDRLKEILHKPFETNKTILYRKRVYRNDKPIYTLPEHKLGRAHFFAPYKRIGNRYISTFWFNLLVTWLFTYLLWVILYFKVLDRIVKFVETRKLIFRSKDD